MCQKTVQRPGRNTHTQKGISQPIFSESTSVIFRYVANLKLVPQAETPGQINRLFFFSTGRLEVCFSLLSGPEMVTAKSCLFNCFSSVGPRNTKSPGTRARCLSGVNCICLCALHVPTSFSEAVGEQGQGAPTGFSGRVTEHRDRAHLLALMGQ